MYLSQSAIRTAFAACLALPLTIAGPLASRQTTQSQHFGGASPLSKQAITHMFAFGDSWLSEGWLGFGSVLDPGSYQNRSFSGGPQWPRRLVTDHLNNPSFYNYAVGGASADNSIIQDIIPDVKYQVTQAIKDFGTQPLSDDDRASHTLVAISVGGNDNFGIFNRTNFESIQSNDLDSLLTTIDNVYKAGIKHFLFQNLPPLDRVPVPLVNLTDSDRATLKVATDDWNSGLSSRLQTYCSGKSDISCTFFDMYSFVDNLLDNYQQYDFSYQTDICSEYADQESPFPTNITTAPCGPLTSYLFLTAPHLTWPAHILIANAINDRLFTSDSTATSGNSSTPSGSTGSKSDGTSGIVSASSAAWAVFVVAAVSVML